MFKKTSILFVAVFFLVALINPSLIMLLVGIVIAFIGFKTLLFQASLLKRGIRWEGRIIKFVSGRTGHKTPIIQFTTMTGEQIQEEPSVYSSTDLSIIKKYEKLINKDVQIVYDPQNPKTFILVKEKRFIYSFSIILILAGLFLLFIGLSIDIP